jgi:hypothetical protein
MNRSCAGNQIDDSVLASERRHAAKTARRRFQGVTVVSIDTNGKVAAELFARQACLAQTANPLPAASKAPP